MMSRYDLPDPKCQHKPTCRVSSDDDLSAASKNGQAIASTYCCSRGACIADASEWVRASTHRADIHVIALPARVTA